MKNPKLYISDVHEISSRETRPTFQIIIKARRDGNNKNFLNKEFFKEKLLFLRKRTQNTYFKQLVAHF